MGLVSGRQEKGDYSGRELITSPMAADLVPRQHLNHNPVPLAVATPLAPELRPYRHQLHFPPITPSQCVSVQRLYMLAVSAAGAEFIPLRQRPERLGIADIA